MANSTLRCIHLLESMRNKDSSSIDYRPKNIDKLKNVLAKAANGIFVCPVLNFVLKAEGDLKIVEVETLTQIDGEHGQIDKTILHYALKRAAETSRIVHVLPCDSPAHEQMGNQLRNWYVTERNKYSSDPSEQFAKACVIEIDINVTDILQELGRHGMIRDGKGGVEYNLPSPVVQEELSKVMTSYRDKWETELDNCTVRGYSQFASVLHEANSRLVDTLRQNTDIFCEEEFGNRYQRFERHQTFLHDAQMRNLKLDDDVQVDCVQVPPKQLPTLNYEQLDLSLRPEVVEAIILLCKSEQKPSNVEELKNLLQPVCRVIYIASPKSILPSITNNTRFDRNIGVGEYIMRLTIGKKVEKFTLSYKDIPSLANLLKYPTKFEEMRSVPRGTQAMDTTLANNANLLKFQHFQNYILEHAKILAQRSRACLVFSNSEAVEQAQKEFNEWNEKMRTSGDDNDIPTPTEFSERLLKIACQSKQIPLENLIQSLMNSGYVNIEGSTVHYTGKVDTQRYEKEAQAQEDEFLTIVEKDFHSGEAPTSRQTFVGTKRSYHRSSSYIGHGHKRMKVINL